MKTLIWFGFVLYLNQMIPLTMFRMSRLGRWGQGIRRNFDIFLCRMDKLLFLCVFHCGFCSLFIFRNLFLLIHTNFHFRFFLLFFCFFLGFPNSFVLSPSFFFMLKIFLSFRIPPYCIIMAKCVFQSLLSLV